MADRIETIDVRIKSGLTIAVPARLDSITTYVLLEQETWFEKELAFLPRFLQPGMTAIDIGANLGIYSLSIAKLVGANGRVFAFEPASEPRALLERSRDLNKLANLEINNSALSDGQREGHLVLGASSELNALGDGGTGERVPITSLDCEDAARNWPAPAFMKIDAEGEEERILAGGKAFFAKYSPLVMFEIKAGDRINEKLRAAFPALGYQLFRMLPLGILVPDIAHEPLDGYELNLFAAKPERVAELAARNLLVLQVPEWSPTTADHDAALPLFKQQAFGSAMAAWPNIAALDPVTRDSLAAYAVWRAPQQPLPIRCAALKYALNRLRSATQVAPTPARLSTFARVSADWGARSESVTACQQLLTLVQSGATRLNEPCWPASARFDDINPRQQLGIWFAAAAAEQLERNTSFSTAFAGPSAALEWLCEQKFASNEMLRRQTLVAARAGLKPSVPERLRTPAVDHLNAEVWRSGKVPGLRGKR